MKTPKAAPFKCSGEHCRSLKTPELDKMAKIAKESRTIGEFLDWLGDQKSIVLAKPHVHGPNCEGWDDHRGKFNPRGLEEYCRLGPGGRLWHSTERTEKLLAEFFDIDLAKVEQEKLAILDHLREK